MGVGFNKYFIIIKYFFVIYLLLLLFLNIKF